MWNSSEIAQGLGICTHTFWQHVSIIFCGSLSYDMGLSNKWVSSIFGTAPVKVRAAKMHCQLPASGNLSVCSLSSILGPPKWHCKTPLSLANTELRWNFFLPLSFLYKRNPTKQKHHYPNITSHYLSSLPLTYLKSRQETWSDSLPACFRWKYLFID